MTKRFLVIAAVLTFAVLSIGASSCDTSTSTNGSGDTASPSQSSPPGHHKKKHKPAHVRTQYYRGVGDKNLGTIVVPVDSTLSWTNAKGDNFVITNDFNDDNTIDVNAIGSHDTSQVAAGKYHKVSVIGTNWTMKIVPNK